MRKFKPLPPDVAGDGTVPAAPTRVVIIPLLVLVAAILGGLPSSPPYVPARPTR